MHCIQNICSSPAGVSAACPPVSTGEALVLFASPEEKEGITFSGFCCFFRFFFSPQIKPNGKVFAIQMPRSITSTTDRLQDVGVGDLCG